MTKISNQNIPALLGSLHGSDVQVEQANVTARGKLHYAPDKVSPFVSVEGKGCHYCTVSFTTEDVEMICFNDSHITIALKGQTS